MKLDIGPDFPQAVPGDAGIRPEVLGPDLIYVKNHLLSVAVLIYIFRPKSSSRVDWQLPVFCSNLDPVVDRPRRGLNFAF